MSVHVKVSGLRGEGDVEAAVQAGADYLGLDLAGRPGGLSPERAADLALTARRAGFEAGIVGVFADASLETLSRAALACDLDVLQLHGNESTDLVAGAAAVRPVWKRIGLILGTSANDLVAIAARHPGAEAIVLDVSGLDLPGDGIAFLRSMAARLAASRPVVIEGGLSADTVGAVVEALDPYGVDVVASGRSGAEALVAFVDAVRAAEHKQ